MFSSRLMLAALRLSYFYRRQQSADDALDSDGIILGLRLRRKGLLSAPHRLWSALKEDNPAIFCSVTIDCPFNLLGLTKMAFQVLGKLRDHFDLMLIDTGNVPTFRPHIATDRLPGRNIRYQFHSFAGDHFLDRLKQNFVDAKLIRRYFAGCDQLTESPR